MRLILFIMGFALAACGGAPENAGEQACPPGLTIVDSWTRPARSGQPVSAAYVTICNGELEDDALIAIANGPAPVAGSIEIHHSAMNDGVMSMKKADRIALPAGARTTFEPGGAHIMLIGVERDIVSGDEPALRLMFEHADEIETAFEVRSDDGAHQGHH